METRLFENPDRTNTMLSVFMHHGQVSVLYENGWQALPTEPANLVDIVIAFGNEIDALDDQGSVWHWTGNRWDKDADARNVVSLASNHVGLWCVNKDCQMWVKTSRGPNTKWAKVYEDFWHVDGIWEYVVKAGDWLWKIVRNAYGTGADHAKTASIVDQVKLLNPSIVNWDVMKSATKLKMPAKTS